MNDLHFPNLTIKGFRGIRELTIPQLGRVNLITGKNNTGKSSVLEALQIFANNAAPWVILDILEFREEVSGRNGNRQHLSYLQGMTYLSALFCGFPAKLPEFKPIVILTETERRSKILEIEMDMASLAGDDEEGYSWVTSGSPNFDISNCELALVRKTESSRRLHRLSRFTRDSRSRRSLFSFGIDEPRIPCVLADPYSGETTVALVELWDDVVLTDLEREVVEALKIINPGIAAISMIGTDRDGDARRAMVRSEEIPRPVPLRTFGDGMNRLLGIALSLVNAGGGLLLIDEFENGLHYSVQPDVWRMIFGLSQKLDIQVFATTHSRDTVEAFQKAAAESPEEGTLIHLTSRNGESIPTVFTEEELAIITRDNIEVR